MVRWLPPGSAAHRAASGNDWSTGDWLAWDAASRLRNLVTIVGNALRGSEDEPIDLPPIEPPATTGTNEGSGQEQDDLDTQVRTEMSALPGWGPGTTTTE